MNLSTHQRLLGALLILTAATLTAGCYTVLKHPLVEMAAEEGEQDCASCHADADLYHFRDPFMDPYGYYDQGMTRWYGYYGLPWWYDGYWYYPHHDYGGADQGVSQDRRLWERGSSTRSPLPRIGNAPPAPNAEPAPAPQSTDDDKGERKDDSKKKKKRRLWGRGG